MTPWLHDLYGHQAWADAEHWRAIDALPAARSDEAIRTRLHHIHLVQRMFRWMVGDRATPPSVTASANFATLGELKTYGRDYHQEIAGFLDTIPAARFDERIAMPWAPEGSQLVTVAEALTQCAMHSQWHRGQNATRLRELGAEPPTVDFIVWLWKGRPAAVWE
jgi:uncharacterized damage-inducible protein DinB